MVDVRTAIRCARLHVPDPLPEIDALIAATALVHGLTVVTRNVANVVPMKVPVFNPWEAESLPVHRLTSLWFAYGSSVTLRRFVL